MWNRLALAIGLLFSVSLSAQAAQAAPDAEATRHYVIETGMLRASGLKTVAAKSVRSENGRSLLALSPSEFASIKRYLHENQMGCGGIVDLAPYLTEGADPVAVFRDDVRAERELRAFDKVDPSFPAQTRQLLALVSGERYRAYLTRLATFSDRSASSASGVDAAQYFATTAQALAGEFNRVIEVTQVPTTGYRQPSVVVKVPGTRPELGGVVIGGHMDTLDNNKPGADDDASGSASVLEVLHAYLSSPLRLERAAYFMFYAAEERGLVGSGVVAKKFKTAGTPIRAALQLDMTGFRPVADEKMYFIQDNVDLNLAVFLERLAIEYLGLTAAQIGRTSCGYACSDHASWTKNGYSAAMPFETSFSNYNRKIHTTQDTLSLIDWAHAEKYVRLAAAFLVETGDPVAATR